MSSSHRTYRAAGAGLLLAACLILALQTAASRMLFIEERIAHTPGLQQCPMEFGNWRAVREENLDAAVTEYLKPDEYILRDYVERDTENTINLFVAYFKSLQTTYGPHSPRVCLPGAGWLVRSSTIRSVSVPSRSGS